MPKCYGSQERQFIANLTEYFKRERENKGPLIPVAAVNERVANALQISIKTVQTVAKIHRAGGSLCPKKNGSKRKIKCNLDETKMSEIRNIIFDMVKKKEQLTIKALNKKLHEKGVFDGGYTALRAVMRQIGFKNSGDGLVELPNVAMLRTNFLANYMKEKCSEIRRQLVYVDSTLWVIENETGNCLWQGSRHKMIKSMKNEGKRYIVFHAGNEHGFLPGAALVLTSKNKNPDFRPEINDQNFMKWFEDQVLQKLEKPSVIIINDASYRSSLVKNHPNSNWSKLDIKNWLQERLIFYHNNLLKTQLLEIVKRNLPPKKYEVDELATKYGHEVLRVPPFHGIFNPMEMIWGIIKNYYNENIGRSGGFKEAMTVFEEALTTASPAAWQNSIKYTETVIKNWWQREVDFDQMDMMPVTINIGEESETEDSDFESDSEDEYEVQQQQKAAKTAKAKPAPKPKSLAPTIIAATTRTVYMRMSDLETITRLAKRK